MAHLLPSRGLSLRVFLIVPFLLEVLLAVGLTGWFSLRNGTRAVNELAQQLQAEVSDRIQQHLESYLEKPVEINALNAESFRLNVLIADDPQGLARRFWQQIKVYESVQYIYFGSAQGGYIGAGREKDGLTLETTANFRPGSFQIWKTNRQGQRTEFLKSEPGHYDPRERAWYQDAIARGHPDWQDVYVFVDGKLGLSATHPIFDDEGRPLGVLAVDYVLNGVSDFLRSVPGSSHGTTFIVEPSGLLVGSSTEEAPLIEPQEGDDKAKRLSARQSVHPSIQMTFVELDERVGSLSTLNEPLRFTYALNGERQFVQVVPLTVGNDLEWLIVVVVPESDFMAQINANTRNTIALCGVALAIAILLGIVTARAIAAPIVHLNLAAQRLADGDFSPTVSSHYPTREVRTLAASFNQMAKQLRIAFLNLEKRVAERTTELAAAKDMAEQASQAKSEFFASMAHDFCTPLKRILGETQRLQHDATLSPQHQETLQTIHHCGLNLLGLVNNTLDLAKITAHQLELEPRATHLASFFTALSALFRIRVTQKGLDFVAYWPATLPIAIAVDDQRLHQVLVNLLDNAMQLTESGTLYFSVTEVLGVDGRDWQQRAAQSPTPADSRSITLRFYLDDRGNIIEPQHPQTLVVPVEPISDRLPDHLSNNLGLTISQQLLLLMDSQLHIINTAGRGHQFYFELTAPVVMHGDESFNPATSALPTGYHGPTQTILVIDNHWEHRAALQDILTPLGFTLIEAASSHEGLTLARRYHPDVIITDLSLPVMDGLELMQQLRRYPELDSTILLAMSASALSSAHELEKVGCHGCFVKPINRQNLLAHLQVTLNLTWRYGTHSDVPQDADDVLLGVKFPPATVLTPLYQAAQSGYLTAVKQEANRLVELDAQYKLFAAKILAWAEQLDDEKIVQYLSPIVSPPSVGRFRHPADD